MRGSAVAPGQLIGGRYRLDQLLSEAAPAAEPRWSRHQGPLWLARDQLAAEAPCALRQIGPHLDQHRARQIWARLQTVLHPQVPRLGPALSEGDDLWLVREWQAGRTYGHLLGARAERQLVFGAGEVLLLLRQLLPVLVALHSQELLHGDLSPENLLRRDRDGLPVLLDFGLVRGTAVALTPGPALAATPGYAAPALLRGEAAQPWMDLHALGVVTLVLLSGDPPAALLDPVSLHWRWPVALEAEPALRLQLQRLLAPDPAERFSSASQALLAFQALEMPESTGPVARADRTLALVPAPVAPEAERTARRDLDPHPGTAAAGSAAADPATPVMAAQAAAQSAAAQAAAGQVLAVGLDSASVAPGPVAAAPIDAAGADGDRERGRLGVAVAGAPGATSSGEGTADPEAWDAAAAAQDLEAGAGAAQSQPGRELPLQPPLSPAALAWRRDQEREEAAEGALWPVLLALVLSAVAGTAIGWWWLSRGRVVAPQPPLGQEQSGAMTPTELDAQQQLLDRLQALQVNHHWFLRLVDASLRTRDLEGAPPAGDGPRRRLWMQEAEEWLPRVQQLPLPLRQRLGNFSEGDWRRRQQALLQTGIAEPVLRQLVSASAQILLPGRSGEELPPEPFRQLWYAAAEQLLENLRIEPMTASPTLQTLLADVPAGGARLFPIRLPAEHQLVLGVNGTPLMQMSVYGADGALLESRGPLRVVTLPAGAASPVQLLVLNQGVSAAPIRLSLRADLAPPAPAAPGSSDPSPEAPTPAPDPTAVDEPGTSPAPESGSTPPAPPAAAGSADGTLQPPP